MIRAKTNMAAQADAFVGREGALAELAALLGESRLVTLTGPGGVGKTRLTTELGAREARSFSGVGGGAWLCDLTEARTLYEVCAAVGMVLGVSLVSCATTEDAVEKLGLALAGRGRTLVVLDNFEQVVDSAPATLPRWMALAPEVTFVVTSRERLRIPGERVVELEPLALETDAVRLFCERAAAVQGVPPGDDDAEVIRDIVRRLEGLPLAIELAAARVGIMSPRQVRDRLGRRFELLSVGARGVSSRQATMRGAIDWSWRLLEPFERQALAQCAVFRGGFDLGAAEAVVRLPEGAPPVMNALQALREKSLLRLRRVDELGGEVRFGLYESIREYAAEAEAERLPEARGRHGEHFVAQGAAWAEAVVRQGGVEAMRRLELERENLMVLFERACAGALGEASERLAVGAALALDPILRARDRVEHHVAIWNRALGEGGLPDVGDPGLLARGVLARGTALRMMGEDEESRQEYVRAASLAREAGATAVEAIAVCFQGAMLERAGRLEEAQARHDAALELFAGVDDPVSEGVVWLNKAGVAHGQGHLDEAEAMYERARELCEASDGPTRYAVLVWGNLAGVSIARGDLDEARERYIRALEAARGLGDRWLEGVILGNLGSLTQEEGRLDQGEAHLRESVAILREMGARPQVGRTLGYLGVLLHEATRVEEAGDAYQQAVEMLEGLGDHEGASYVLFHWSALEAGEGELEEARRHREAARAAPHDEGVAAMEVLAGAHEALALARRAQRRGDGEAARAALASVAAAVAQVSEADEEGGSPPVERFDGVRSMLRLLERAQAKLKPRDDALQVHREGSWFKPPGGEWTDFRRRKALRRLLVALATQRLGAAGVGVTLAELMEAGWPGEVMSEEVGANRVYVAITTLRKFGLRETLRSDDSGWFLDPALPVFWSEGPNA